MKIKTVITASFLTLGCEAPQKAIDEVSHLKELGYVNFNCDKLESNSPNIINVYTYVEPQETEKHMLVARCKDFKCRFEEISNSSVPQKFVCLSHDLSKDYMYREDELILTYNVDKFADIKN